MNLQIIYWTKEARYQKICTLYYFHFHQVLKKATNIALRTRIEIFPVGLAVKDSALSLLRLGSLLIPGLKTSLCCGQGQNKQANRQTTTTKNPKQTKTPNRIEVTLRYVVTEKKSSGDAGYSRYLDLGDGYRETFIS